jgi:hypothetical protein
MDDHDQENEDESDHNSDDDDDVDGDADPDGDDQNEGDEEGDGDGDGDGKLPGIPITSIYLSTNLCIRFAAPAGTSSLTIKFKGAEGCPTTPKAERRCWNSFHI